MVWFAISGWLLAVAGWSLFGIWLMKMGGKEKLIAAANKKIDKLQGQGKKKKKVG